MNKEKIALIGITGRMGIRIAKELLARGFEVIGINRRPERVKVRCDFECPTVKADAGRYDEILAAIQGADTVIMVTEPTREHPEQFPADHATVLRACKAAGVKRFITLLNHYALKAPDGRPMLEADPEHPLFQDIARAYPRAAGVVQDERELDWVIFATPAEMVPYAGKTGVYRIGEDVLITTDPANPAYKETSRLSMEDMADCIVDQVERNRWNHQIITAAY